MGEVHSIGGVLHLRLGIQDLQDARPGGHGPLQLGILHHQVAHWLKEALHIEGEGHQGAQAQMALGHPHPPYGHHQSDIYGHKKLHHGHHRRRQAPSIHIGRQVVGVDLGEPPEVLRLAREGLHHPHPGHVLLQIGVDHSNGLARP
jgi:hypothetical protein